jgi:hypothetical protein
MFFIYLSYVVSFPIAKLLITEFNCKYRARQNVATPLVGAPPSRQIRPIRPSGRFFHRFAKYISLQGA